MLEKTLSQVKEKNKNKLFFVGMNTVLIDGVLKLVKRFL